MGTRCQKRWLVSTDFYVQMPQPKFIFVLEVVYPFVQRDLETIRPEMHCPEVGRARIDHFSWFHQRL
jgi:hypothetical protein